MGVREQKLDFWRAKGKTALFIGSTGVGKTQMVLALIRRTGLSLDENVAQWSSALVDFVGPSVENADVLFFDDYGDEKSREAAKEVLSLRRWKGKAIKPTAAVWACYTTRWDEKAKEYVELDKQHKESFEVIVSVPNSLNLSYFEEKFGKRVATVVCQWWNDLPCRSEEEECLVTPRRLEQALDMWLAKGDMRDVLPVASNVTKLVTMLNAGPMEERLTALLQKDEQDRRLFLLSDNNFTVAFKFIMASDAMIRAFLPCLSKARLRAAMEDKVYGDKVAAYVAVQNESVKVFENTIRDILQENTDKKLVKKFRRILAEMSQAKLNNSSILVTDAEKTARTVSETPKE